MTINKSPVYLFGKTGLEVLSKFIDRTTLFAFDIDGTLAPIVANPSMIMVPHKIKSDLIRLDRMAAVAIITGRARADALAKIGFNPGFLAGNHGAEGLPGRNEIEQSYVCMSTEWENQLQVILPRDKNGWIVIENKGATLSIHYRKAPDQDSAHKNILAAINMLIPVPRRISGMYVENIIPPDSPNKGEALLIIMNHLKYRKALYIGDDETDEDVFRIGDDKIFGIRVGLKPRSEAKNYIREQNEIENLLNEIIAIYRKVHK